MPMSVDTTTQPNAEEPTPGPVPDTFTVPEYINLYDEEMAELEDLGKPVVGSPSQARDALADACELLTSIRTFDGGEAFEIFASLPHLSAVEDWLSAELAPPYETNQAWEGYQHEVYTRRNAASDVLEANLKAFARTMIDLWIEIVGDMDQMIAKGSGHDMDTAYRVARLMGLYEPAIKHAVLMARDLSARSPL